MSEINYQALREAAEKAGEDKWQAKKINGDFFVIRHGSYTRQHGYTSYQPIAEIDCKSVRDFVAKANPATVLALLDERERNQQYIKRRDQENEEIALTVGKLRVELEETKSKLNEQREYYEGVISDGSKRIAELEEREILLPERSSMLHRTDFNEDYHTVMAYKVSEVIAAIRAAGIRIKGE
ncbi:ead/Ea22-like family protein [Escherichia coli]|uniref:ead/Ea22-like family protein n=1 Tax=Escherichia coli TaxID=562 RepID=UPI000B7E160E|nr:ead/Ea22-like family protein [Escherichia coli]HDB9221133.1 ead/Ea22-like family protein [Escherichia coli]